MAEKRAPGRPPAEPIDLDPAKVAELMALAESLIADPVKMKKFMKSRRVFHVVFQDYLSTIPIPGGKGVAANAEASKRFMDFSGPLLESLRGVEEEAPTPKRGKKS